MAFHLTHLLELQARVERLQAEREAIRILMAHDQEKIVHLECLLAQGGIKITPHPESDKEMLKEEYPLDE